MVSEASLSAVALLYCYFICELRELLSSLLWLVHLSQHTVSLDYRRSRGLKLGAHAHGGFCAGKLNVRNVNVLRNCLINIPILNSVGFDLTGLRLLGIFIGFLTASLGV